MNKDLIEKFLLGELDYHQTKELMDWIEESKSNRAYFARMKNLWVATHLENENPNINLDDEYGRFRYRLELKSAQNNAGISSILPTGSGRRNFQVLLRIAATIVLIFSIIGTISYIKLNSQITYTEIITKRGEKSYLALADGTRIWLNSETTFRYPSRLDSKNVEVYLDGEAYFDVAKNPKRKFIVKAASLDIAVLGTSFNVKSYSSDNTIETTLEEGKISITGKMGKLLIKDPVILMPNQQATFIKDIHEYEIKAIRDPADERIETPDHIEKKSIKKIDKPEILYSEKIDSKLYTSWKDGKMIFKSTRFKDIAVQMERWYDMKIEITDEKLKDIKYTGVFEKETIEQALYALSLSFPFHYEINQNKITISKAESK